MFYSIITITYNCRDLIKNTVESVHEQTCQDYELLIIDGLSVDGTIDVVNSLKGKNDLIFSEKDEGIADAFNKGLKKSTGEWIIFLNAGDSLAGKTTLESCREKLEKCSNDVMAGKYCLVDQKGNKYVKSSNPDALLQFRRPINPICHQAVFVRRKVHELFEFDSRLHYTMDFDLWLRMKKKRIPFGCLPIVVAEYSIGGRTSNPLYAVDSYVEHWNVLRVNGGNVSLGRFLIGIATLKIKLIFRKGTGNRFYEYVKTVLKVF